MEPLDCNRTHEHFVSHANYDRNITMNEEDLQELEQPGPQVPLTPEEILMGPPIAPKERVRLYDEDKFEEFILEWAFLCLQKSGEYIGVRRFGGSRDLGRDIVGYLELPLKGRDKGDGV